MRLIILLLASITVLQTRGQQNYLESLGIDSNTKLIGYAPQAEYNKAFQRQQFIIEDSATIVSFLQKLKFGNPDDGFAREESFVIAIIKNFKIQNLVSVFPASNNAKAPDGKMYHFDFSQLSSYSSSYPLRMTHRSKVFPNKAAYDNYLTTQQQTENFLFFYAPEFLYEGSFEMEFPVNDTFTSPQAIMDYLKPFIERIVNPDEYDMYYEFDKKNRTQRGQKTITILASRKLFDALVVPNRKKENWRPMIEEGDFYYKQD